MDVPGFSDLREVGPSGWGTVYRARRLSDGRHAVLEVLDGLELDDDGRLQFEAACHAVGERTGSVGIATILGVGATPEGVSYVATEAFEAGSLADGLAAGPMAVADAERVGAALATALQVAHGAGVRHGDVRAANVFLDSAGQARLTRFAIAPLGRPAVGDVLVDWLRHASPAVVAGEVVTERDDVYSLGATLFELLTGQAPFTPSPYAPPGDDSAEATTTRMTAEPTVDLRAAGVPDSLAAIIETCLERDPDARFQSAAATHRALVVVAAAEASAEAGGQPRPRGPGVTAPGFPLPELSPPTQPLAVQLPPLDPGPPAYAAAAPLGSPAGPRPGSGRGVLVAAALVFLAVVVGAIVMFARDDATDVTADQGGAAETEGTPSDGDGTEVLREGSVVTGEVGDGDTARFQLEGSGNEVAIEVEGLDDFDPVVSLFDESGDQLASDDDSGVDSDSQLVYFLGSGDGYGIEVTGYGDTGGEFRLSVVDSSFATTVTSFYYYS